MAHLIAEDGPLQGLILKMDEGEEWVVGRSLETANLLVDDGTVSRRHAKIFKTPDGFTLENLSRSNATLVNGEEPLEPILLKEGDEILIGETTFRFTEEEVEEGKSREKSKKESYDDIFEELDDTNEEKETSSDESKEESPEEEKEETSSYDTIFEDLPDEEELPFNLPPETPYLLKVISGPNAGAEIGMEKGHSYTLGKDSDTCDIIFQDLSVSRSHAKISVGGDGVIEIEDLGSKNGTAVNGTLITEKKTVTSQDLIALGTTIFLIIDREAPQETIYAPLTHAHEEIEEQAPPIDVVVKEERNWKTVPIPTKHLVWIGSIAALFLIVFITFFSLFRSDTVEVAHKDPISEIKEALNHSKFSDVEFTFNPASGKLFLVGHVLTSVDYQEMRYQLDQIPFILSVEDTVVIDEGVSKIMNDVLSGNSAWKGISIRAVDPGKFVATGYLQTNTELSQVSDYLAVNFPYLDKLENKIAVEENLNAQIGSMLMKGGFSAVSYELNNGNVVLSGVYDNRREMEFKEVIREIKHMPSITLLKNYAIATSPNLAAIDISSHYQVSGISFREGKGFNAVLNGKIYSVGDLVNGMDIINIEENTILLEKDGVKYKIGYTR